MALSKMFEDTEKKNNKITLAEKFIKENNLTDKFKKFTEEKNSVKNNINALQNESHIKSKNNDNILQNKSSVDFECDLRNYLAKNLSKIEDGLTLIEKEYNTGTSAGIMDLFCKDSKGNYIVIELKKYSEEDKVIGQILRYIGWIKQNKKTDEKNINVRGIIIVNKPNEKLDYAIIPVNNFIKICYYKTSIEIFNKYIED